MAWSDAARKASALVRKLHSKVKATDLGHYNSAERWNLRQPSLRKHLARQLRAMRSVPTKKLSIVETVTKARESTASRNHEKKILTALSKPFPVSASRRGYGRHTNMWTSVNATNPAYRR